MAAEARPFAHALLAILASVAMLGGAAAAGGAVPAKDKDKKAASDGAKPADESPKVDADDDKEIPKIDFDKGPFLKQMEVEQRLPDLAFAPAPDSPNRTSCSAVSVWVSSPSSSVCVAGSR